MKNKEIRELKKHITKSFKQDVLEAKERIEIVDRRFYLISGEPWFFLDKQNLVPTLRLLLKQQLLATITVDMGAIRHIINGAAVMRPGITKIDPSIEKGDLVAIVDIHNEKPIAVGRALVSAEEMEKMEKGKAVTNLHYVGDEIWGLT